MINRLLIRIKIVQLVYASLKSNESNNVSDGELMRSMESSYRLYNYLLALIVKLSDYEREQLEAARNKYMPTDEERNPNMRFVNNRVSAMVRLNSGVVNYCEDNKITNDFDTQLYRSLMEDIKKSVFYMAYMDSAMPAFEADKELWIEVFNNIIPNNSELDATLEEKDIYWNDDLCVVNTFVVKTIQKLRINDETIQTFPMFKSSEDEHFARDLFHASLDHAAEYQKMINEVADNWEVNRMPFMDQVIMLCALAEIINCPNIPVRITLNEYIELAKHYSTPTSGKFINGILDRIVKNLRQEGIIFKA